MKGTTYGLHIRNQSPLWLSWDVYAECYLGLNPEVLSYIRRHTDTVKIASYNYQWRCSLAYGYDYGIRIWVQQFQLVHVAILVVSVSGCCNGNPRKWCQRYIYRYISGIPGKKPKMACRNVVIVEELEKLIESCEGTAVILDNKWIYWPSPLPSLLSLLYLSINPQNVY